MKKSLILLSIVLSSASFASIPCYQSVEDQYLDMMRGTRFDRMPNVKPNATYLKAGEVYDIRRQADAGPFSEDKLIFVVTGSIHSGWFSDALIVNPENCEIERIQEIDSE